MAYHMRFFDLSRKPIGLAAIETALRVSDPAYRLTELADSNGSKAMLALGDRVLGNLTILTESDQRFQSVMQERNRALANADDEYREAVEHTLAESKRFIEIELAETSEDDFDAALEAVDPLWDWLFDSREGLLHAEGEGYYQDGEIILEEI